MMKFNFSEPLFTEDHLRYRFCYNYKTHCRYVAVILALTALATTLSVCLALRTVQTQQETKIKEAADPGLGTACGHRMAHRKWKETKQQPSLLPRPAVPGCSLVSFHFLWAILCLCRLLSDIGLGMEHSFCLLLLIAKIEML